MKKKTKKFITFIICLTVSIVAFGSVVSLPEQSQGAESKPAGFCVVYNGRKILKNAKALELVPENATFSVQTLEGEPIEDYDVVVVASSPKSNFVLTFDGVDSYDWSSTYVSTGYNFTSAGIEKNGSDFTIRNVALSKILSAEYDGMSVSCSASSFVNALRIDVTVENSTLSMSYVSYAPVAGVYFSEGALVC